MTRRGLVAFIALQAGLLSWLGSAAAAADSGEAARWLEKVSQAARTLNYEGVFVYQHKGGLEAMRIIHRADNGSETERLYSLTGPPREIIRDDETVTCILPNRSIIVDRRQIDNPLSQLVPQDIDRLTRNYALDVAADGRVAGRPAKRINIVPRDKFRFGYRLWVDLETGLLLRADVFDGTGSGIEQLMFTELRTPTVISPSSLEPQLAGEAISWRREDPAPAPEGVELQWEFEDLPPGFELVSHEALRLPGGDAPVDHLLFSDGLANVSVYVERTAPGEAFKGHSEMGAVRAYGLLLDKTTQITAVGEVPAVTVERIAASVVPPR